MLNTIRYAAISGLKWYTHKYITLLTSTVGRLDINHYNILYSNFIIFKIKHYQTTKNCFLNASSDNNGWKVLLAFDFVIIICNNDAHDAFHT